MNETTDQQIENNQSNENVSIFKSFSIGFLQVITFFGLIVFMVIILLQIDLNTITLPEFSWLMGLLILSAAMNVGYQILNDKPSSSQLIISLGSTTAIVLSGFISIFTFNSIDPVILGFALFLGILFLINAWLARDITSDMRKQFIGYLFNSRIVLVLSTVFLLFLSILVGIGIILIKRRAQYELSLLVILWFLLVFTTIIAFSIMRYYLPNTWKIGRTSKNILVNIYELEGKSEILFYLFILIITNILTYIITTNFLPLGE